MTATRGRTFPDTDPKAFGVHSPVLTVTETRGTNPPKAIGRRCLHCGALFTLSGRPSEPHLTGTGRGETRRRENLTHVRRMRGDFLIGDKMAKRIQKEYRRQERRIKKGDPV